MSQIYKPLSNSGPFPPQIPTQFTADDGTISVPSGNNENLLSNQTSANNFNGIQTTTIANGSANHYTQLTNRITGTATTTDAATPVVLTSFILPIIPATYILDIRIIAYDITDNLSAGYSSESVIRSSTIPPAVEISSNPGIIAEEGAMTGVTVSNFVTGNTVETVVQGLLGKMIHWRALTTYILVS